MKINKIEVNITFLILSLSVFLLNFSNFTPLAIIFGFLLSFFLILLTEKLNLNKYKLTNICLLIISLIILPIYLNKLTYFISNNILKDYSGIVISILLLISSLFLIKKGYHTIIKVVLLSSYFIILILLLGLLSSIYFKLDNFTINILKDNNLFRNTLLYSFLIYYTYFLTYGESSSLVNKKTLLISSCCHLLSYLLIIGILGLTLTNLYEYVYIVIYKKINFLNFIERIEFIFALNYLFCFYYFFLFSFYKVQSILNKVIKKDKLLTLTLVIISIIIFTISIL